MNNSFLETAEAKAIKLMRLSDPDFDIYSMELEMSHIAKKIFEKYLEMDADYIKGVTSGQALDYFMQRIDNWIKEEVKPKTTEIISISKSSYLGVNTEDKTNPKFSYSFTLKYTLDIEENFKKKEENEESFMIDERTLGINETFVRKTNYFVTFTAHPDPDILTYEHPWQFLVFYPSEGSQRVN